ncbi:hypothetical protein H0H92_004838 [Tricholoma furcatifolium]|nr:hypothetical protein H0H92_004838 [Tricholoma furcatifolium]
MAPLGDDLLADLEELSDDENQDFEESEPQTTISSSSTNTLKRKAPDGDLRMSDDEEDEDEESGAADDQEIGGLVLEGGVRPAEELDAEDVQQMELGNVADVTKVAKLEGSKRMADVLNIHKD